MNRHLNLLLLGVIVILSGCDGGATVYVEEPGVRLDAFHIIDSDGVSSEFVSDGALHINPEVSHGQFEFYWYASSFDDYWVALSVNTHPGVRGAVYVAEDYCGPGLSCDESGLHVCEITTDYYLGCGIDPYEAELNSVSIGHLLDDVAPDTLYFNLEVCGVYDSDCHVKSYPVLMY